MLACVASVSNRVIARKLERRQKKSWRGRGGGERRGNSFLRSPPPPPSLIFLFALVPAFSTNLARKRLLRRLGKCLRTKLTFKGKKKNPSWCVDVLYKTCREGILCFSPRALTAKKCTNKVCCTWRVVVLLIKSIIKLLFRPRCRSRF